MLWIAKMGVPWRDLPERYRPWHSVASRFYRWRRAGQWSHILTGLQIRADAAGHLDWSAHFVDGKVVRAHQHAAGARLCVGGAATRAPGWSRGGFSTKLHLRAEGAGKPLVFLATAASATSRVCLSRPCSRGGVKRMGRGRPRVRPQRVVGDKGYSSRKIRRYLW